MEYKKWFKEMLENLTTAKSSTEKEFISNFTLFFKSSIIKQPVMFRLISILHLILEQNISLEAATIFKKFLFDNVTLIGKELARLIPTLYETKDGVELFTQIHAMMVGFLNLSEFPPNIKKAMKATGWEETHFSFENNFITALEIFLKGVFLKNELS